MPPADAGDIGELDRCLAIERMQADQPTSRS
jgi:hypothetical protein